MVLAHAIAQGKPDSQYILIHVVESASARLLGKESDDFETHKDEERLQLYVQQLAARGLQAVALLGFRDRAKEIVRLVQEQGANMLVIGAHATAE